MVNAGTQFAAAGRMSPQKRKHPDTDIEQAASEHSRHLQPGTGTPMPADARRDRGEVRKHTAAMKKGRRGTFP
jgi:hypothetical protein